MRDIKFRCWIADEKKMIYSKTFIIGAKVESEDLLIRMDGEICWCPSAGRIDRVSNDCVLMQYTGLKDKNGVEVYEFDYLGDWCVFWGAGKYILHNISNGDIVDCNEKNTQQKEITGNRFENPREHKAMASDL